MSTSTYEDTAVAGAETPALMKAAVVHSFTEPLRFEEVATPVPGEGEVLVRIEASGLCHTDIHAAHGDWPVKPTPPFVPGHEGVGIVEQLGAGVTQVALGDRVAVPWLGYACGSCDHCVSGWETLCTEQRNTGYSVDGGFAEFVKASARLRRPRAGRRRPARRRAADLRGRHDLQGGQGLAAHARPTWSPSSGSAASATWRSSTRGSPAARVVAVDVQDDKLALARELGADFTVNAAKRGSGRRDPGARRRRRRDRPRGRAEGVPHRLRLAPPRRHARVRRPAGGERRRDPDLRDRAERDHDRRLDRRHAQPTCVRSSSSTRPAAPASSARSGRSPR